MHLVILFNCQQKKDFLNSKDELKGQIATLLGGRSAEEVVFGKDYYRSFK